MTGIELLRKYAGTRQASATCRQLPDALGKECDDFRGCNDCHMFVCNAIADQIKRETLPRTRFEDGKIARIGEVARYLSKNRTIADMYVDASGYHKVIFDDNSCLMLRPSEMLERPKPTDTWERIVADAKKDPCAYFGYDGKPCCDGDVCPAYNTENMDECDKCKVVDLVRRCKALAGVE